MIMQTTGLPRIPKRFALVIGAVIILAAGERIALSQAAAPTPAQETPVLWGGYHVTAALEFGVRGFSLDGSENKYRSDLNYRAGFRTFDSEILLESSSGKGKIFDSLLITNTGWGADPTGNTRVNIENTGYYKFNANVRRVKYYNNLLNHALGEHSQNTRHTFGDFDLTMLPQNESLRFLFGGSFSSNKGPGTFTTRAYSDEFMINSLTNTQANDLRVGAEGKLLGFNFGVTQGYRSFRDRTSYNLLAPSPGNNLTNTSALATFVRHYPVDGHTSYTSGTLHRTFSKRVDFTGRLIHSITRSKFSVNERITGRDNSNAFVDLDQFNISGGARRLQTRGDVGLTFDATGKLRISETFTIDRFSINGDEAFEEALFRRNAAGSPLATTTTRSTGYRLTHYRRFVNTLEFDYSVNNRFSFHMGHRYTQRRAEVDGVDRTLTSAPSATNPLFISEEESNATNALIAGTKIKPRKNWVIYGDVETGTADNVFTRVENYRYTNFRVRSRISLDTFSLNVSAITRDNENPSFDIVSTSPNSFTTSVKGRTFSGELDWTPRADLSFSTGYTYRHLTSYTPIIVPVAGAYQQGFSQYFARDNYAHADLSMRPFRRLSLYAAYRISLDKGQGDRVSSAIQNFITSYPMQYSSPEVRASVRLTRNIDWNVGYQYYNYRDSQTPLQNYRAHLPYTSLRIYFGSKAADR